MSFLTSETGLTNATFWINVICGSLDFIVVVAGLITVFFGEFTKAHKKRLEKLVAAFAVFSSALVLFNVYALNKLSELQSTRLKSVEEEAQKAQEMANRTRPAAQPVVHLSATIHIRVGGEGGYADRRDSGGHVAGLMFGESCIMSKSHGPWVLTMASDKVDMWGNAEGSDYFLDFRFEPIFPIPNESAEELLGKIDMFSIQAWFLKMNTEIAGGSVTLQVNSVLTKKFTIPPQSTREFLQIVGGNAAIGKIE